MEDYMKYLTRNLNKDRPKLRGIHDYSPYHAINDDVTDFQQFFEFLEHSSYLPRVMFHSNFMDEIRAKVTMEAKKRGYELFSKSLDDNYRLPVSYLISEERHILLAIHWPALNLAKTNKVYHAEAVPTALPSNHDLSADGSSCILPDLSQEQVIIRSGTSEMLLFPADLNLDSCTKATETSYQCDEYFFYRNKPLKKSCLNTLLEEDTWRLKSNCQMVTMDCGVVARQGEHAASTTNDNSEMICNDKAFTNTKVIVPNVTQLVILPMGRGLELETKSLRSGFDQERPETLEIVVKLNLEPFGRLTLTMLLNDIRITLDDAREALWEERWKILAYCIFFGGIAILIAMGTSVCLLVYFGYGLVTRYQALRRMEQEQVLAELQAQADLLRRCFG